jgi:hypothetical protein
MTSFAAVLEPAPQPRLAALVTILHAVAAALPWLTRCPPPIAAGASALAAMGLWASLARVPGPHGRLQAVALDAGGCRVRLAGSTAWTAAELSPASRVSKDWALVEVRAGRQRLGWLLPRACLPPDAFRRLKALIRLT